MDNLYPLADLQDPLVFLGGARIPIQCTVPEEFQRYSWDSDCMIHIINPDLAPCHRDAGVLYGPRWERAALDLTDPDVARWCDRKIAEAQFRRPDPELQCVLVISTDRTSLRSFFALAALDPQGCSYLSYVLAFPHLSDAAKAEIAAITPTESNIPTARAALLRALFGRKS